MFPPLVTALILGLVEGVTEFLPVSSTGHMILVGHWIGFTGEKAETFEIFIQLGAILAVVVLYWKRFLALIPAAGSPGRGLSGLEGILKIAVACAPAFIFGFLFHKQIKEKLFSPVPVAAALIAGGLLLLFIERLVRPASTRELGEISRFQAFSVGVFQCLALWPGVSRSGSMIVGGLTVGMNRITAAEFSFLVAVPIMAAATGYDLLKSYKLLTPEDVPLFAAGFTVSFLTAILSIRFFLALLARTSLRPFGIYRIALGGLVIALLSF